MFQFRNFLGRFPDTLPVVGAAAVLLAAASLAPASGPPYGIPTGVMPWEYGKYRGYSEAPQANRSQPLAPAAVSQAPSKYVMQVTHPKVTHEADNLNVAILMAHLPEDAAIFFDSGPTKQKGKLRWFETAPLAPGHDYTYNVKVVWSEDGKWVTQTRVLSLRAGETHCIDIVPGSERELAEEIAANLAKLSPDDQKQSAQQKYCVVQTGKRLGEMGVPVKVLVNDQPVFLCCDGCERAALSNPERTLAKVKQLNAQRGVTAP